MTRKFCIICGLLIDPNRPKNDDWEGTIDHNFPVDRFPEYKNQNWNKNPAHRWCNSIKGNRTLEEFRSSPDFEMLLRTLYK